ncbi:cytochrome c3 family protein [Pararcticibacter amylolyticus]|uniref:Cytochrome C n=1 Tax=Pararcticibacter amylolyticus TaxID=2173175 RepID=A0A2U2PBP1_9SPHI|nr:cytochrome c3 family protein [Pararcticibacter amylolyticus]PWG78817.1 cytochrome C [Pararcticibacter amylolyticus]
MSSISLVFRRVVKSLILVSVLSIGIHVKAQNAPDANAAAEQSAAGAATGASAAQAVKGDANAGGAIFKQKCTACHAMDRTVVGPALKGVHERHDEAWLIKWIKNSQALVAAGDPAAVKVFNEYNKTVMTPFPELSDDDVRNILAYIQVEGDKPAAPAGGAQGAEGSTGAGQGSGEVSNFMLGGLIVVVIVALLVILVLNRVIKTLERLLLQKQGIVIEEEADEEGESAAAKIRRLSKNKKLVFFITILLIIFFGTWGWIAMWNTGVHQGYQPTQPIKYSHQLHAGTLKIDCQYCHSGAYKSKNASIPSLNVCMNCHNYVQATEKYNGEISPEIMKIYKALDYDPQTKQYGSNPKPIQWVRIHNLPDFAYFNHSQHVSVGGLACQKCHGPIQTMSEVYQYSPLTMKWCINCHRENNVNYKGNAYYDKVIAVHDQLKKGEKVTPAVLGGLECGKCHY